MLTNPTSGTQIDEIAKAVYRISTPVPPSVIPGGFSFNQYLLASDEPLLFHTGPRKMFPLVRQAIEAVVPVARLAYIGLSHFEADECGALNDFLAVAPRARPVCGRVAALVSIDDVADRPAHVLGDGDALALGSHQLRWFDAPHLPHAWECGYLFEESTATLFCGDLFTQPGRRQPTAHTRGHSRTVRSIPRRDGLLLPHQERACAPRPPCQYGTTNLGVHAWQRLGGRRSRIAAGTRGAPRGVISPRTSWALPVARDPGYLRVRAPRRRSALVMTDAELILMAIAAIMGESSHPVNGYSTPAASGTPSAL